MCAAMRARARKKPARLCRRSNEPIQLRVTADSQPAPGVLSHDLAIADRQQVHSDTLISAEDSGDYDP